MIKKSFICITITAMVVTGCTAGNNTGNNVGNNQTNQTQQRAQSVDVVNFQVGNDEVTRSRTPVVQDMNTGLWVPLKDAADAFGFTTDWDKQKGTYRMGYTDVLFETTVGQSQALAGEKQVQLSTAPKLISNEPYITVDALSELWQTPVKWNQNKRLIHITPFDVAEGEPEGTQGGQTPQGSEQEEGIGIQRAQDGQFGILAQKDINMDALIRYGNRFLGTPYKWGSSRYTTKTFDCSSFVKHVYGHFGVKLPRGARDQSKLGYRVAYKNLKKGDLVYFWIKKRVVGHVGIYAGNGRVLHTYGKGGVRYNNMKSGYWRYHFFFAKRVAR